VSVPPDPYSDTSSAPTEPGRSGVSLARGVTEGMRYLAASALLAGNGVLLFLGVSNLLFVVSGWVSRFGARSEVVFDTFAGPVAIALPLLAMLIATHVHPVLPQARAILQVALIEYAVSGFFGVITYLGAFAEGVFSIRSTVNGLISRAVWLAFLAIAAVAVYRVYRVLFPPTPRLPYGYGPPVYGQPYPGQPTYPRPGNYTAVHGTAPEPTLPMHYEPTLPIHYEPIHPAADDATIAMGSPTDQTRVIPPVPAQTPEPETRTLATPIPPSDPPAAGSPPNQ
jgi:hypothetical protein